MNNTPCFSTQRVRACKQLFTDDEFIEVCELIRQHGATIVDESDYDVFHLVHYFSGDEFEELCEKGYPLVGAVVCMDGFKPVVRDNMSTLARLMNAKYVPQLTNEVTHLIAETVRCDFYQPAAALGIKILRPQWLFDRWSKVGEVLAEADYLLECFTGLTICVTGVEVDKRNEIKSLTAAHGGEFSGALDRSCTHLLAETASSMKVRFATSKLNIPILHTDWFYKSIDKGVALPVDKYIIHAAKTPPALPAPSQLHASQLTVQSYFSADNSKDLLTPPASSVVNQINGIASSLMPATPRDLVQKYKHATPACSQTTQHSHISALKSAVPSQAPKVLVEVEKKPLTDCSVYLCGFADEISELFQNMVRQMGGKCIDLAVDHISNVTHVVIGDSSKSQLRTISRLLTMRNKPLLVTKQWIEECYKLQVRLSELAFVFHLDEHLDAVGPIDLSTDHVPPKPEPVRALPSQTSHAVPSQPSGSSRTTAGSTQQRSALSHSGSILMGPPKSKLTAASDFKTVISKSTRPKASLVETAQTMRRVLAAPVGLEPLADSVEQNTGSENTGEDLRHLKAKKTLAVKKRPAPAKPKPRVSSSSSESLSDEFMFQPPSKPTGRSALTDSNFTPGALMHFEPEKNRKPKSPKKKQSVVPRSAKVPIETKPSDDKKRPRPAEHNSKQTSPTKKKKVDRNDEPTRQVVPKKPELERKDSEPISLNLDWMIASQPRLTESSQALYSQAKSQAKEPSPRSSLKPVTDVQQSEYEHSEALYPPEDEHMAYQEDLYNEQELPVEEEYENEIPVSAELQDQPEHDHFFPTPYDSKHNNLRKSVSIDINNPNSVQPNALEFEDKDEHQVEDELEQMDEDYDDEELIGESSPRQGQQLEAPHSDAEKTHSVDEAEREADAQWSSQLAHGYPLITNITPNKGPATGGTLVFVYCEGCQEREQYLPIKVAFGDHVAKTTFDPEKSCYWAITPAIDFLPNDPDAVSVPVYLVYTDPQQSVQEMVWNPPGKQFYYQFRREGAQTVLEQPPHAPHWTAQQISDIAAKQKQRLEQYLHALKLNTKREAWMERLFEMEKDMNILFTCVTQLMQTDRPQP